MWVYYWRESVGAFIIGFFAPNGDFQVAGSTTDENLAQEKVHYLNGGD